MLNNNSKRIIHNQEKKIFYDCIIVLGFVLLLIFIISIRKCKTRENFAQVYKKDIYGNLGSTYDDNKDFYNVELFRKPYRYPVGIAKSYPVKHISPLS